MNDLISIIIPAYKAQNTIEKSIFSVLNQEYINTEIIVIVDGLDDSTYDVVSKIDDSRIKLYKKENQGVVSAYKFGISKASGKYVMFCDSDDAFRPGYVNKAYELISDYNCDFVSFAYNVVDLNGQFVESIKNTLPTGLYQENDLKNVVIPHLVFNSFEREKMFIVLVLRWNKIYKKELIDSFFNQLDENCRQIEDNFFTTNVILNSKSFYICNDFICYDYLIGNASISSGYNDDKILEKYMYSIEKIADITKNVTEINPHQVDLLAYDNARIVFRRCAKNKDFKTSSKLLKEIKNNSRIKNVKFSELKMIKNKIFYLGLKFNLFRFLYLVFKR